MDRIKIAKKHFQKYGLSEKVLGEIVALLPNDESATEETIIEQLQAYEPIAKSFQSEIERRVAISKKAEQGGNPSTEQVSEQGGNQDTAIAEALLKLNNRLDAMEKGQLSANLNKMATNKLKALNLSEKEIEAVMYGRNFETEDAVEEFVSKQGEYFEEIINIRTKDNAGGGFAPMSGQGNLDKKSLEQDVEEFNKQF